ncbi:MAG: hypothetical protein L0213_03855 [Candidatus Dadabacteria bacterium]|nr:hypothetical protein [Candidatus Dadabacteria bacterium]
MQVRITKKKRHRPAVMLEDFAKRYGSLESLQHKVAISKCASPAQMDDLVIWKNLQAGAELVEEIVLDGPDIYGALSPRRVELVEYLAKHGAKSIRQLSATLKRNYKNIYDDLRALGAYDIVEFIPAGRSRQPACFVSSIETVFDE